MINEAIPENEIMIDIRGVSKRYKIGQINAASLNQEFRSRLAKLRGKEDPNTKIGKEHLAGQTLYALRNVDLQVRKGETLGIIGSNGAGKSTLLKLICRVTAPTEGSIDIYGRLTSMLEVGTGFDGELTGRENIYINGAILGMSRAEITRKIDDIIEFAELRDFIDTPVKRYSSGMYIKLGFSVAMHLDSEIMIMDEVLAVGDQAFQNKCIRGMKEAARSAGKTVLYVSHNMNQIRQLCDRCAVLRDGEIIFIGETEDAIALYLDQALRDETRIDYREYVRPSWVKDQRLRLLTAEYSGERAAAKSAAKNGQQTESTLFLQSEAPRVRMEIDCRGNVDGVCLRIEIRDATDRRVGTYILYDVFDCREGEQRVLEAEYELRELADGLYNTVYTFFVRDDLGNNRNLDCVPGLSFSVHVAERPGEVHWDKKEWGYVRLQGSRVTDSQVRTVPSELPAHTEDT